MLWLCMFLASVGRAEENFDLESRGRWSVVVPVFVAHGILPEGGAQIAMPRKLDPRGRFVATPGVGVEFEGTKSLDLIAAFLKDCYDDFAGTVQAGQYFNWGKTTRIGYSVGLYIRQTPITCFETTSTTKSDGVTQSAPPPLGGIIGGGGSGGGTPTGGTTTAPAPATQPSRVNRISTTTCLFDDNLPIRYTFKMGGGYVDIIPSPFLNFSTRLWDGPVQVFFKFMTNFYLNEFGLAVTF